MRKREEDLPDAERILGVVGTHLLGVPRRVPHQDNFDFGNAFELLHLSLRHRQKHLAVRAGRGREIDG